MKKNYLDKVQSILFDMDGVIVDSMIHHAQSWQSVLSEYGIEINENDIYKREGMTGLKSVKEIFYDYNKVIPQDIEINKLIEKKHKIFEKLEIKIFPQILQLLTLLKKENKSIALVTGSLKRSVDYMLPEKIISYFDIIVTADDVDRGKPDPEPYERAMEGLSASSNNSLVIENAPMGILSAKNANLCCFAIETTLPVEYLKSADLIFKNHTDLYDYIKRNI